MRPTAKLNLEACKQFCRQAAEIRCNYPQTMFYDSTDHGWCEEHDELVVRLLSMALEAYQYFCYFNQPRQR